MKYTITVNRDVFQDAINIATGLFAPLNGFMGYSDYVSVLNNLTLMDGSVWTIPITLDVDKKTFEHAKNLDRLYLSYNNVIFGYIIVEDCFETDSLSDALKVYKTTDYKHPGVNKEIKRNRYRIGGAVEIMQKEVLAGALDPNKTREVFKTAGWSTIAGFQTRNPPHRAHEYLHRIGLDICDGLFINPLVGWKKNGDFSDEAVMKGYEAMINSYYPKHRVHLAGLSTAMRYAGPREAIFHAIIRRNLGCTHFFIGRDHAGVGDYYGKYEAQELARKLSSTKDLGIELLLIQEPYYCKKCNQIVTSKHCGHDETNWINISGTKIRNMLSKACAPESIMMRDEVATTLISLGNKIFIEEDNI